MNDTDMRNTPANNGIQIMKSKKFVQLSVNIELASRSMMHFNLMSEDFLKNYTLSYVSPTTDIKRFIMIMTRKMFAAN